MLKTGTDCTLKPEHIERIYALLEQLSQSGTIGYLDYNAETDLYTDASDYGVGIVAIQDGKIVGIYSQTYTSDLIQRNTTDRELMAMSLAHSKFNGRIDWHKTTIWTDHQAIIKLLKQPTNCGGRRARVVSQLNFTGATIRFIAGKNNNLADFFSRSRFPPVDLSHIDILFSPKALNRLIAMRFKCLEEEKDTEKVTNNNENNKIEESDKKEITNNKMGEGEKIEENESEDEKRIFPITIENKQVDIKVMKLTDNARIPTRGTEHSAGLDLFSAEEIVIKAKSKDVVRTDIAMEIPLQTYGRIASRSSLAKNNFVAIGGGVIDSDYRGNITVIIFNHNNKKLVIKKGDKIAQIIIEQIVNSRNIRSSRTKHYNTRNRRIWIYG